MENPTPPSTNLNPITPYRMDIDVIRVIFTPLSFIGTYMALFL